MQTALDDPVRPRLSAARDGSCVWFVHRGRRSYSLQPWHFLRYAHSCGVLLAGLGLRFMRLLSAMFALRFFFDARTQASKQLEFGLEVNVVRQFQMLHEARCFDVVAVIEHEFRVLRRRRNGLAKFLCAQGTVYQRHRHGLTLRVAKREAVPLRERGRHIAAARELVDHLALGDVDIAYLHRESQLFKFQFDGDFAITNLAGERMRIRIAALRGITDSKQETLIGTS